MKKLFFIAATAMVCLLISCNDSGTSTTSSTSSDNATNDSNLEKNHRVMKAIETGDSATIRSLIADDAVDHQGPHGDVKGGDSITHWLADMHNHMKDLKFDLIAEAANGDYIFSMTTFKGTCTDASMGMPAGTVMNEKVVDVVKVKDGKMVEHWGFMDAAAMMNMPGMGEHKMNNMAPKDTAKKY